MSTATIHEVRLPEPRDSERMSRPITNNAMATVIAVMAKSEVVHN